MNSNFVQNYHFQFYGSADSLDKDIVIFLPELPEHQEHRKILVNSIKVQYALRGYNIMLAKLDNGVIVDCMVPAPVCGLNNSVYSTYSSFDQHYSNAIKCKVPRNIPLACYRAIHFIMTCLCRTQFRKDIRPIMHFNVSFKEKLDALEQIDFKEIIKFNQPNMDNIDIWKKLAFYIVQHIGLRLGKEIYNKQSARDLMPGSTPFINRSLLNDEDKEWLTSTMRQMISIIRQHGYNHFQNVFGIGNQLADIEKGIAKVT